MTCISPPLIKSASPGSSNDDSNVDGENRAGSQLEDAMGCRTKDGKIQGAAATHGHSHQLGLPFQGELNDLLVWFADKHGCFDLAGFAPLRRHQFIELLRRCRY